jgi:mercuric reductase
MTRMQIEGMTCEGCAGSVADALAGAGAEAPRVDFEAGEARFDAPGVSTEALRAAVEAAGYRVVAIDDAPAPDAGPVHRRGPSRPSAPDLVVIGSGGAAFAAAIRARDLGAEVAMCEAATIGGTCVNIGCVPSKALLAAASARQVAGHHPFPGITTTAGPVDLAALVAGKDELVNQLRFDKYEHLAEEYGFTLLCGRGSFTAADRFVCDGEEVAAGQFLVATGASPAVPPIPGLAEAGYLTSTTAFELRELPSSLVVIGANAIGLEVGQLFLELGTSVTFVEAASRIAPLDEPEISAALTDVLRQQGAQVHTSAAVTGVERRGMRRVVTFSVGGSELQVTADQVLVATGRRPNTAGLGLEAAGVGLGERGAVVVDEFCSTSNARIWAAGDVTGAPQFVYVAAAQGALAADNAIGKLGRTIDWEGLPKVTFTTPQIASVGLTEEEATRAGHRVETRVLTLDAVPRALVERDTAGLCKIVAEEGQDKILGVHLLARGAGEVILAATYAVKANMTVTQLAETWAPYLTMAEALKLTAQTFTRDVSRLSCCAA